MSSKLIHTSEGHPQKNIELVRAIVVEEHRVPLQDVYINWI